MKWITLLAAAAGAVYLFTTEKGKRIRTAITSLAREGKEMKDYLGNIGADIKEQKLQYGQQPEPVASRQN